LVAAAGQPGGVGGPFIVCAGVASGGKTLAAVVKTKTATNAAAHDANKVLRLRRRSGKLVNADMDPLGTLLPQSSRFFNDDYR
jgi:hypothetical protein